MNLKQIKEAVGAGKTVHWSHEGYVVLKDRIGQWHIKCLHNGHCIGLTHMDGVTMNGQEQQFFIREGEGGQKIAITHFPYSGCELVANAAICYPSLGKVGKFLGKELANDLDQTPIGIPKTVTATVPSASLLALFDDVKPDWRRWQSQPTIQG